MQNNHAGVQFSQQFRSGNQYFPCAQIQQILMQNEHIPIQNPQVPMHCQQIPIQNQPIPIQCPQHLFSAHQHLFKINKCLFRVNRCLMHILIQINHGQYEPTKINNHLVSISNKTVHFYFNPKGRALSE